MVVMRSKLVPLLIEHAAHQGLDADALADRFGVPVTCRNVAAWSLDTPPLPIARTVELANETSRVLEDPWLGLSLADDLPRGAFGVQEFAVRNAPSMAEAALRLTRYQRLTNDAIVVSAERNDDGATLSSCIPGLPEGLGPHLNLFLLATVLRFVQELSGEPLSPREVNLAHARGAGPEEGPLVDRFGTDRLRFGAGANRLVFEPGVWDLPIPEADSALLPILEAHARAMMPPDDAADGWRARVREHLRRNLSGGAPTLAQCARSIGMSPRSLQRRLEDASTSYRAVLDALREEEGRRMMADTELSIDEVSFLLGYSERRAFMRAFRRWTDASPGCYRERHRRG